MTAPELALPPGVLYDPSFAPPALAARWFASLQVEVPWQIKTIVMFGKPVVSPRLTSWHGEPHARYRYSGLTLEPLPWTPTLQVIRERAQAVAGALLDSVLANLYRDGCDGMGWHADDEPELGRNPVIASVSLGAPRRFVLRERATGARSAIDLAPGSLLVMSGDTQHRFVHAVPKTSRAVGPRINLTYRRIVAPADPQRGSARVRAHSP